MIYDVIGKALNKEKRRKKIILSSEINSFFFFFLCLNVKNITPLQLYPATKDGNDDLTRECCFPIVVIKIIQNCGMQSSDVYLLTVPNYSIILQLYLVTDDVKMEQ